MNGVAPRVEGISVKVTTVVAAALEVRNRTRHTLEVIGNDGRPFVRLGPRGVEANVSSPDLYRSNAPVPGSSVPSRARSGEAPVWVRIARQPAWSWFEHRLDPRRARAGDAWAIPARIDGRGIQLRGTWAATAVRGVHRTVVERIRPQVDGLVVEPLAGGPALLVQNTTGRRLEILDERDRPFLRVGPDGVQARRPPGRWTKLGTTPAWAWLERRAGPPNRDWSIDARLGGRPLLIAGRVDWQPISAHHDADNSRFALVALAVITPLLLASLILVPRLRR